MFLHDLKTLRPPYSLSQSETLLWIAKALSRKQKTDLNENLKRLRHLWGDPRAIGRRYFFLSEFLNDEVDGPILNPPPGQGSAIKNNFYQEVSRQLFSDVYQDRSWPQDLIHVTCTGYRAPSAAQWIAAQSPHPVEVLHAYHMGCYASIPALRIAQGLLAHDKNKSIDVFHTELCTLHLDLYKDSNEQLVIQSLFGDGAAVYRLSQQKPEKGFEILGLSEMILPDTGQMMSWSSADQGFSMTLSKKIPVIVRQKIKAFILQRGGPLSLDSTVFAIHPGGPKIIEAVAEALNLRDDQYQSSRQVLFNYGNMSSSTLPHIWESILHDDKIPSGCPIISLGFGPGLTIAATWMRKI